MSEEFPIFSADNSTADADELSETDIRPILAHCRKLCCWSNSGLQYRSDIGLLLAVLLLAE